MKIYVLLNHIGEIILILKAKNKDNALKTAKDKIDNESRNNITKQNIRLAVDKDSKSSEVLSNSFVDPYLD